MSTSARPTKLRNQVLSRRLYTRRQKCNARNSEAVRGINPLDKILQSRNLSPAELAVIRHASYDPWTMRTVQLTLLFTLSACVWAQPAPTSKKEVEGVYPEAHAFYLDLHQNPELSSHETQTATKLAGSLRNLGYDVTEHVGGTGIVAVLKNGNGPTVMLRTELDALPVEEKTGLPYASKVHTKDDSGRDVPVMHACGHDLHMAILLGTAEIMARSKNSWHGTLLLIGQPAEETVSGARKMVEDGLLTRFPRPDAGVALHVGNDFPAGKVAVISGYSK